MAPGPVKSAPSAMVYELKSEFKRNSKLDEVRCAAAQPAARSWGWAVVESKVERVGTGKSSGTKVMNLLWCQAKWPIAFLPISHWKTSSSRNSA